MTRYAIYFMQQWVGDHPEEWFHGRVAPSKAAVEEMREAGVLVFAGGLVEDMEQAFSADGTSGTMVVSDGPYTEVTEYLGGITIIEVETIDEARKWAAKIAEGCGWPQEVRVVK